MDVDSSAPAAAAEAAPRESGVSVPYTVCYVYDKNKERSYGDFMSTLRSYMNTDDDIIFSKECQNDDPTKDNRYMIVIRKDVNDNIVDNEQFQQESQIVVRRYKPRIQRLNGNTEYGYYIKTDKIPADKILNLFGYLESKSFIHPGSYLVHHPQPYPDGSERKYMVIEFQKHDGNLPRGFISKLRNLLNDTVFEGGEKLRISWLQRNVFEDIKNKRNKKVSVQNGSSAVAMEV